MDQYKSRMYDDSLDEGQLRSGDIVQLQVSDLQEVVRHRSALSIFQDFDQNKDYSSKLWAILNKSCDMVHDPKSERIFDTNLFLIPLQGLQSALRKGTLGKVLSRSEEPKTVDNIFKDAYEKYLSKKIKEYEPRKKNEDSSTYNKRVRSEIINPILGSLNEMITDDFEQMEHPKDVLDGLIDDTGNSELKLDLKEFQDSNIWKRTIIKYEQQKSKYIERDSKIFINKSVHRKLSDLAINQLDSKGIFFYEPMANISSDEHDLSYIIQLEDMITVKIMKEAQESGKLFDILIKNRKASLTRNFSDRLLNIMGNYFSKIGTPDIILTDILKLYTDIYPENFIINN